MISFNLICSNTHEFEGWFSSSSNFDAQKERGLVECPVCGDKAVEKSLMAPSVATSRSKEQAVPVAMNAEQQKMMSQIRELTKKMREGAEDVGEKFAEEARKIHYGETEARGIYGQATPVEAKDLADEGVEFIPLPTLPEDQN